MGNQNLQKLDRNNLVSIVNDINKGRTDKALVALDKLIKSFPDDALLFNLRGACHEAMNQFDQSIESFNKAVEIHPLYEEALYNLGVVQKKAGKPDEKRSDERDDDKEKSGKHSPPPKPQSLWETSRSGVGKM